MTRSYIEASDHYRPKQIRTLFIAESPPAFTSETEKSYFYFEENPSSEVLFATIVEALYNVDYRKATGNKPELLKRFQSDGYWLMDVSEEPINIIRGRVTKPAERKMLLQQQIPNLIERMKTLKQKSMIVDSTGIILIKKLVFEVLAPVLSAKGYNLLHAEKIDFPKYHRDRDTVRGIWAALAIPQAEE